MGEEGEGWLLGVAGPVPPFQVPQHPPGPVNSHPCPVGAGLSRASSSCTGDPAVCHRPACSGQCGEG